MEAADDFMFNSTWECNPLVLREAIGYGKSIIAESPHNTKTCLFLILKILNNFIKEQLKYLKKTLLNIGFQLIHLFICKNHVNLYKKIMKKKTNRKHLIKYNNILLDSLY
jgi:hypothetical protein